MLSQKFTIAAVALFSIVQAPKSLLAGYLGNLLLKFRSTYNVNFIRN